MADSEPTRRSDYLLLSVERVASRPAVNIAVLLFDAERDRLYYRFRRDILTVVDSEAADVMSGVPEHLVHMEAELGGSALLRWMEDTLSNYIRISERFTVPTPDDWRACVDRLFVDCVVSESAERPRSL